MHRYSFSRILVFFVFCGFVHGQLFDIEVPPELPFSGIINGLTGTTIGLIRGSANFFGRTVDRIVNTFSRVEDRLRELLEEARKLIIKGIPEFNIPILDPLHIDHIQFEVVHDAANINGTADDVTIKHISKFVLDDEEFADLGAWNFKLDLNLTFPFLRVDGNYDVNALIGNAFSLFGKGKFWMNLYDLKIGISTVITFEYTRLRLKYLSLNIKLKKMENDFQNLMNNTETGKVYNKVISRMAPEAIDILWPELKLPIEQQILKYINNIFENATIVGLARKLFNIV